MDLQLSNVRNQRLALWAVIFFLTTVSLSAAARFYADKQLQSRFWQFIALLIACIRWTSFVGTLVCLALLIVYGSVTLVYNWRRQYRANTNARNASMSRPASVMPVETPPGSPLQPTASLNELEWRRLQKREVAEEWLDGRPLESAEEIRAFLAVLKVFNYLDEPALDHLTTAGRLETVAAGQKLAFHGNELVLVTSGSFQVQFVPLAAPGASAASLPADNELRATIQCGGSLTSYVNVMRSLGTFYHPGQQMGRRPLLAEATALSDAQIMVIDEAVFHELAKLSALTIAHLTQVILTRFKRATLPVIVDYFNLTVVANSILLPYFLRQHHLSSTDTLTDLQGLLSNPAIPYDRAVNAIFTHLLAAFELDHGNFTAMESSLNFLKSHIQLHTALAGRILQAEGRECRGAFLVLDGEVDVGFVSGSHSIASRTGDIVGVLSSLMGKCSAIQVVAETDCTYALISAHLIEMMAERDPKLLFANIPSPRVSDPLIEFIDLCVDWQQRPCGSIIRAQNAVIRVVHGRIRDRPELADAKRRGCEFGAGAFLGEEAIFRKGASVVTECIAVRQSETVLIPAGLIEGLVASSSTVASSLLPRIFERQRSHSRASPTPADPIRTVCVLPVGVDVRTVGISNGAMRNHQMRLVESVAKELETALHKHDTSVLRIDSGRAAEIMGRQLFTTLGTLKMTEFLAAQEDAYRVMIYVADAVLSSWTRECIGQADVVLLVGDADGPVIELGDIERHLLHLNCLVNVELCLVSAVSYRRMESGAWICRRPWVQAHHHLLLTHMDEEESTDSVAEKQLTDHDVPSEGGLFPGNVLASFYGRRLQSSTNLLLSMIPYDLLNSLVRKSRELRQYLLQQQRALRFLRRRSTMLGGTWTKGPRPGTPMPFDDFGRLARRLLGRSVGLVLGGGGARGLAHIGIVKALQETGLTFDLIGGTSMGAFVGGLLAREGGFKGSIPGSVEFSQLMASIWRHALDLTYPATSWFSGHGFNRAVWKAFGTGGIEDFPIPFFAVTTDLTRSRIQVHRAGPAWQFVRASMSLSGFHPPVCDVRDGTLLVDGGYLANVPIDVMREGTLTELSRLNVPAAVPRDRDDTCLDALSASVVIAIDIGRFTDRVPVYYGDSLSGWRVLWKKLRRFLANRLGLYASNEGATVPLTLDEIQFRLAYASSAGLLSRTLQKSYAQMNAELKANPNSFLTSTDADVSSHGVPSILYLRPSAVLSFATLDFDRHTQIIEAGYAYGRALLKEWRESGLLLKLLELQGRGPKREALARDRTGTCLAAGCGEDCNFCAPHGLTKELPTPVEPIPWPELYRQRRSSI